MSIDFLLNLWAVDHVHCNNRACLWFLLISVMAWAQALPHSFLKADRAQVRPQRKAQLGPESWGDKPLHGGCAIPFLRDHVVTRAGRYLPSVRLSPQLLWQQEQGWVLPVGVHLQLPGPVSSQPRPGPVMAARRVSLPLSTLAVTLWCQENT